MMKNNVYAICLYFFTYIILIPLLTNMLNNGSFVYFMISLCLALLLTESLKKEKTNLNKKIKWKHYLIVTFMLMFLNLSISTILIKMGVTEINEIPNVFQNDKLKYIILSVVIMPIIEEIIWKVILLKDTRFLNDHEKVKIVIIALVFAIMHVNSDYSILAFLLMILYYMSFYITTSLLYVRDNNIGLIIAIHALCNLFACVMVC